MKILLVDDEFLARNAVMLLLKNAAIPSLLIHEAVNGQEAIEKIQKSRPDIALIDVSMPVMNGIALLGWIQKNAPDIYCVVLSSYSDFEFVRDAMKLGAKDYLLKHQLTQEAVMAMLGQSGRVLSFSLEMEGSRERDLEAFLSGANPDAVLPWVPDSLFFTLPLLAGEKEGHAQSVLMTCRHALEGEKATVALPKENKLAFVFPADRRFSQAQHRKNVAAARRMLCGALERYHNLRAVFSEPALVKTAEDMHRLFAYHPTGLNEYPSTGESAPRSIIELENGLITAVLHNNQASIALLIRHWFENAAHNSKSEIQNVLETLLDRCWGALLKQERPPAGPAEGENGYIQAFSQLARQYQHTVYAGFPEIIRKVIVYINANSDTELSLTQIAGSMNINYSYLSFLFKKETGIGITQYINALRVSNAMRLILLENAPIAAVSGRVGFNHYNHFVMVFKSIVGLSPASFKKHPDAFAYMMAFSPLKPARLLDGA